MWITDGTFKDGNIYVYFVFLVSFARYNVENVIGYINQNQCCVM